MAIKITLKNSVVQDSVPTTTHLPAVGELAVNANINSIGGYMRASDDTIVKIFGPGSVTTPAASTTVAGIAELATSTETTTGTDAARVVTPAGLKAVTDAERTTSNSSYIGASGGTLTGALTMPNGSNSAPSMNFGDADSGIYGGTNTVSLAAGGVEGLTLGAAGALYAPVNLGVGSEASGVVSDTPLLVRGSGTTILKVDNSDDGTSQVVLGNTGSSDWKVSNTSANLSFILSSVEKARIDSGGKLLVGHNASIPVGGSSARLVQINAVDAGAGVAISRTSADTTAPYISLGKARGSSIGDVTAVQENDVLGTIQFAGADGTDLQTKAALIKGVVDGTVASNDIPGRLEFYTFNAATDTLTEQFEIKNDGTHTIQAGTLAINGAAETLLHLTSSDAGSGIKLTDNTSYSEIVNNNGSLNFTYDGGSGGGGGNLDLISGTDTVARFTASWGHLRIGNSSLWPSSGADDPIYVTTTNSSAQGIVVDGSDYNRSVRIKGTSDIATANASVFWIDAENDNNTIARIRFNSGFRTTNKDDGRLLLETSEGSVGALTRVQIEPNGNVGIGSTFKDGVDSTSPQSTLHISSAESIVRIESTTGGNGSFLQIKSPADGVSKLLFADTADDNVGMISYEHATNEMIFRVNDSERFRVDHDGLILWNTTTPIDESPIQMVDHAGASGIYMKHTGNRRSLITADSARTGPNDQILALVTRWSGTGVAAMYFLTGDDNTNKDNGSIEFHTASNNTDGVQKRLSIDENGMTTCHTASGGTLFKVLPTNGQTTPAVVLSSNCDDACSNVIRFVDEDESTGGGQAIGKLEFYSSDPGGDGAGVSAVIAGRSDDAAGQGEIVLQTQSTGNGVRTGLKVNMNGQIQTSLINSNSGTDLILTSNNFICKKTSSRRYKKNIKTIEDSVADKILNCNPVWFQRNEEDDTSLGHYGFIAEEIHEIDPTFVVYEDKRKTLDSDGDYVYEDLPEQDWLPESVKYTDFIPLLVNLIKRQDARITALESK